MRCVHCGKERKIDDMLFFWCRDCCAAPVTDRPTEPHPGALVRARTGSAPEAAKSPRGEGANTPSR